MKTFSETSKIVLMMILITISSCGKSNKKDIQEFTGTYKLDDNNNCFIELLVTSNKDDFHYRIKTNKLEKEGRLEITKNENEVYFKFIGLFGTEPKEEISGQYMDKKIVIQNYGNAMNEFTIFSECDMKYLELEKFEKE